MKDGTIADLLKAPIYVESLDGEYYGGKTYGEIVAKMRDGAWGGEMSDGLRGYMKQVSKRVWDWSQQQIRISTPEMFLRDMERFGLIKVVRQGEDK